MSRTKFRKDANAADNKGATVAVDSLINYEAVKVHFDPCHPCRLLRTKSAANVGIGLQ